MSVHSMGRAAPASSATRTRRTAGTGRHSKKRPEGDTANGKQHRILEAAIAVFAENGFFNSRVSDIARRADVADGTIYLYFKNKEQILMAAIDFAFHSFMSSAKQEVKAIDDPRRQLYRLAELHLQALGSNRGMATVFQTELRQSARFLFEFSHQHLIEYFDLVREIVRVGQRSGHFRTGVSDKILANCFFGSLDAMVTSWLLSERPYKLVDAADAVVDVVLNGLEARR
jgi:TetR/AcrR family fatty acid metabolism transcriptional regulator